ncbi:MAG TPA: RsmE family RNA methyltransferase [Chlamydiales bacterium]|nr:RsmE family RNA methyltransferase [Chlamydiales bacterium]
MPVNRFFLDASFSPHDSLPIEGEELAHMRVLRLQPGEELELINGKGSLATCTLNEMLKTQALVKIEKVHYEKTLPSRCLLVLPMIRMPKLEWILEKGTELGVTSFSVFIADNSEKEQLTLNQRNRLKNLLISAMKQCGRLDLPEFHLFSSLQEIPLIEGHRFFGDTKKEAPLLINQSLPLPLTDTLFFTGPEKGFTEAEISYFQQHHIIGVKLSPYILRTETAPIAAASLIRHLQASD